MRKHSKAILPTLLILLAAAGAGSARAADSVMGTIQICRVPQAGDRYKGIAIEIPLGAAFGDTGHGADRLGNYWPLWIATTEHLTIGADESCANTSARITANLDNHAVKAADNRWFTPAVSGPGRLPGWPGGVLLGATALTDFRSQSRR